MQLTHEQLTAFYKLKTKLPPKEGVVNRLQNAIAVKSFIDLFELTSNDAGCAYLFKLITQGKSLPKTQCGLRMALADFCGISLEDAPLPQKKASGLNAKNEFEATYKLQRYTDYKAFIKALQKDCNIAVKREMNYYKNQVEYMLTYKDYVSNGEFSTENDATASLQYIILYINLAIYNYFYKVL